MFEVRDTYEYGLNGLEFRIRNAPMRRAYDRWGLCVPFDRLSDQLAVELLGLARRWRGQEVKFARKKLRDSRRDFASRLDVWPAAVRKWEEADTDPAPWSVEVEMRVRRELGRHLVAWGVLEASERQRISVAENALSTEDDGAPIVIDGLALVDDDWRELPEGFEPRAMTDDGEAYDLGEWHLPADIPRPIPPPAHREPPPVRAPAIFESPDADHAVFSFGVTEKAFGHYIHDFAVLTDKSSARAWAPHAYEGYDARYQSFVFDSAGRYLLFRAHGAPKPGTSGFYGDFLYPVIWFDLRDLAFGATLHPVLPGDIEETGPGTFQTTADGETTEQRADAMAWFDDPTPEHVREVVKQKIREQSKTPP